MTTRCHSVRSFRSPVCRSRHVSDVATDMFTIDLPSCMDLTSGSRPRLPTRMTLFTLPAIWGLLRFPGATGRGTYLTAPNLPQGDCGQPPILGCSPRCRESCSCCPADNSLVGPPPPPYPRAHE